MLTVDWLKFEDDIFIADLLKFGDRFCANS